MTESIERRAFGARVWPRIALGAVLAAAPGATALAQTAADAEIEEVFVTAGLSPFGALKTAPAGDGGVGASKRIKPSVMRFVGF